ncbi:hypothetical protein EHS25_009733 [Saitozyma podzolica]|uniref:Uncharacterized protein n=1 Tax=Saitozyma podzolica TaxID=1890683 RepID=A0A427YK05_9TREE|nr:hypothetical protein EHS25_009733 [Saitozyma podzolica]
MSEHNENVDGLANRIDGRALPASPLEERHGSGSQANKVQVPVALHLGSETQVGTPAKQGPSPPASQVHVNCGTEVRADPLSATVDDQNNPTHAPAPLNSANGRNHGDIAGEQGDNKAHSAAEGQPGTNAGVEQGSQAKPLYSTPVGKTPYIYLPVKHNHREESLEDNHREESPEDNHRAESLENNHRAESLEDNHRAESLEDKEPWINLKPNDHVVYKGERLGLFYDLVVVAVLSVFSTTHELSSPHTIVNYLLYYIVLYWTWVSQTYYDVRFQAGDLYHYFFKLFQMSTFAYIGAASGNWNPGHIQDPGSLNMTGFEAAQQIFEMSFWASRQLWEVICPIVVLLISMALSITAASIDASSASLVHLKIGLLYTGIVLEFIMLSVLSLGDRDICKVKSKDIAERYRAFTLIILGEGFISLLRAASEANSSLSTNDAGTYGQVVVVSGLPPQPSNLNKAANLLDKLPLIPDNPWHVRFKQEMDTLIAEAMKANRTEDTIILAYQYLGQIIVDATRSYGVEVTTEMSDNLDALSTLNVTYSEDQAERSSLQSQAKHLAIELTQDPIDVALSGTQWLYPTAVR